MKCLPCNSVPPSLQVLWREACLTTAPLPPPLRCLPPPGFRRWRSGWPSSVWTGQDSQTGFPVCLVTSDRFGQGFTEAFCLYWHVVTLTVCSMLSLYRPFLYTDRGLPKSHTAVKSLLECYWTQSVKLTHLCLSCFTITTLTSWWWLLFILHKSFLCRSKCNAVNSFYLSQLCVHPRRLCFVEKKQLQDAGTLLKPETQNTAVHTLSQDRG